jgi:glycosyltransferase involved in cell wall biosynthesis
MRIAVEVGWAHKAGGARRVAVQTIIEMVRLYPQHEYQVYANSSLKGLTETPVKQKILAPPWWAPQVVWDQFIFPHVAVPKAAAGFVPDVIHFTNNMVSFRDKFPAVVSIYDMLPFVMPKSFIYWHALYQRIYFRYGIKKAKKIITISNNSKEDICRILKVDEKKVHVIPLAPELSQYKFMNEKNEKKWKTADPYILYAGAIHPRKNIAKLIRVFERLVENKKIPHSLVIAGSFRWKSREVKEAAEKTSCQDKVLFTGQVSDEELAGLYKNCAVFVYPSLYEGFGLPVLEAMAFGVPVVTSNVSSLPEVAGDAALLVDPRSDDELYEAVWRVLDKPDLAAELGKKALKRAALFNWERTAREVFEVLKTAAEDN